MLMIYGIYDKKLGEYGPQLNCERNSLMALRNLGDVVKRLQESPLALHADDFDLMCLGELDERSGVLTGYPTCRFVENVGNLLRTLSEKADVRQSVLDMNKQLKREA